MLEEKVDLAKWVKASKYVLDEWTPVPAPGTVAYLCGYCGANEIWVDERLWGWEDYEIVPF